MRRPASSGNLWRSSRATASLLWLSEAAGRGAVNRGANEREREEGRTACILTSRHAACTRTSFIPSGYCLRSLRRRSDFRNTGLRPRKPDTFISLLAALPSLPPPTRKIGRHGRIPGCRLDQRSLALSSFCILPSRLYGDETYEVVFLRIVDILLLRRIWVSRS